MILGWTRLIFFTLLIGISSSLTSLTPSTKTEHVQITVLTEEASIQPGHPFWVAIRMEIDKDWHTYWKNPGDAGMPTAVNWTLPNGFTASDLFWPIPEQFIIEGVLGYGYEKETVVLAQITPPELLTVGQQIEIGANIRWLVCSDSQCVPGDAELSTSIPVLNAQPKINQEWIELFTKAREKLPTPQPEAKIYNSAHSIELHLPLPAKLTHEKHVIAFYPEQSNVVDFSCPPEWTISEDYPDHQRLVLKKGLDSTSTDPLKGLVVVKNSADNTIAYAAEINADLGELFSEEPFSEIDSLGLALLLAFLGGGNFKSHALCFACSVP